MPDEATNTLDSGEKSIIRLADFVDYGLYLLYRRQTDKEEGFVEATTADKMFRLLHKLSRIVSTQNLKFDLKVGLDRNGIHGKGIAFQLKSAVTETSGNDAYEEDEDISEIQTPNLGEQRYAFGKYQYSCNAIQTLEKCVPGSSRLISDISQDGRKGYRTMVGAKDLKAWEKNKRLDADTAELIKTFANFINRLEDRELICLGRHENIDNTENSIQFLFTVWKKEMVSILGLFEKIYAENRWPDKHTIKRFEKLFQCSEEMISKSETDREYYKKAYCELEKETNLFLKQLIIHQSPSDMIWGEKSRIREYIYIGYLCHSFTVLVFFVLAFHKRSQGSGYDIPPYITKTFDIDYKILPCVIVDLLKMDIMSKKNYSKEQYLKTVQEITEKLSCNIFDFERFQKNDFPTYLQYFKETLTSIKQEYDKLIGMKPRRIERDQNQMSLSI